MKNSLKLLFVLPAYEPAWSFGGVVRCMSNLCRGLAELGHKVTVYTVNADGHGKELDIPNQPIEQGRVLTYFFPSTFGPSSVFDSRELILQLKSTVRNFDLVYVSAIWQWLGVAVSSVCFKNQVPLVVGIHGSLDQTNRQKKRFKKMLFEYFFLKKSLAKASAIHLTTEHERQESLDLLANSESFIVPNSLDCNYFRPMKQYRDSFRNRFGIPLHLPLLIGIGRADEMKRFDLLIRALALTPDLYLLIVGPELCDLTRTWKRLAEELHASDRIVWTGHLDGDDLLRAYGAADIFSLISDSENFGMVVVEAMACGLPVLINPEVGVSETLNGTEGVLLAPKNAEAIAQILQGFLSQRERWNVWGENNLRLANQLFAIEKVAVLMAQTFENILNRNLKGEH